MFEDEEPENSQGVYGDEGREDLMGNDEISPEEEAFMSGYDTEDEKKENVEDIYDKAFDEQTGAAGGKKPSKKAKPAAKPKKAAVKKAKAPKKAAKNTKAKPAKKKAKPKPAKKAKKAAKKSSKAKPKAKPAKKKAKPAKKKSKR